MDNKIKSNLLRANITRGLFYSLIAISIIAFYSNYLQYMLLKKAALSGITPEEASINDLRQQVISVINILLLLVSTIFFLMWVYRAYENLYKIRSGNMHNTPGWAVGFWFVPIVSFYKPYEIMKDIWVKTQEHSLPDEQSGNIKKPYLVGIWWAMNLLNIIASYFVTFAYKNDKSIDGLITLTVALMFTNVFTLIVKTVTLILLNNMVIFEKNLAEYQALRTAETSGNITGSMNVPGV
jgi:hypothetical protein